MVVSLREGLILKLYCLASVTTEVEAVCVNMRYVLFLHFGFFNILKISVIHIMTKKKKEEGRGGGGWSVEHHTAHPG